MLMIGVISYLPKDEVLRQKRLKARHKQAEWLHELFPNKTVNVVAQCYQQDELLDYENNIVYEQGIGPARARNVLLKMFYESDYDHILFLDDDIAFYDYYNPLEFLNDLDTNPDKYSYFDTILSNMPQFVPFKKQMYKDPMTKTHFKFTWESPNWGGGLIIFSKSIKGIYFDDTIKNGNEAEDADMFTKLMFNGYKVYVAHSLQMKLLLPSSGTKSTLFTSGNDARLNAERQQRLNLAKKYGIAVEGLNVKFKETLKSKHLDVPTPVYYPRLTNYEIPEKLIPKEKQDKNKLF